MKTFTITGYEFKELNSRAKQKVRDWYLSDSERSEMFEDEINEYLRFNFPKSDLTVSFSLSSCQGDGLNIKGVLYLHDFIEFWQASEKEQKTFEFYLNNSINEYAFETNNRYCYSCKFIDRKYIEYTISDFISELQNQQLKNIKTDLIKQFFNDMLDFFEKLDKKYEDEGYDYFYNVEDTEIQEFCEANDYYFDIDGNLI